MDRASINFVVLVVKSTGLVFPRPAERCHSEIWVHGRSRVRQRPGDWIKHFHPSLLEKNLWRMGVLGEVSRGERGRTHSSSFH